MRKFFGYSFLAAPFIAMGIAITYSISLLAAVAILGGVGLIVGSIIFGVFLLEG